MAYLDDNPPVRTQFRDPRREAVSGVIVVHTAENVMDKVGPDTGAEAVANFIRTHDTPGSYHELVDTDTTVSLVRWTCEAFHDGTGTNPHSFGLSFACSAADWPKMTEAKRAAFIKRGASRAAAFAGWVKSTRGIVIPAARITRDESTNRVPGFVSHAQRDPGRRTDPGQGFPWSMFLDEFRKLTNGAPAPAPGDDMPLNEADKQWLHDLIENSTGVRAPNADAGGEVRSDAWRWTRETVDGIRELLKRVP